MGTFQERLKLLRKEKNLTIEELAKNLGSAKSTISRYENGLREPKKDFLELLCSYFNVSTDYLLGKTDERNYHFPQTIGRVNRVINHENLTSSNLDKDTLKYMIQNMIDKIDNTYILKQAFFSIYGQLDMHELIDEDDDKNLIRVRNILAHSRPSDEEFKDLLKLYKSNRDVSR